MPLVPTFQLRLGHPILPNLVTVGRYDGRHPSLTCATTGGKIFVHSPHNATTDDGFGDIRFLNINQKITALAAMTSRQQQHAGRDCLFVGTPTNLLFYDVQENADVFYRDVDDGVSGITVGRLSAAADSPTLAIVGGSCNVQGFDTAGDEQFWSVTGDNVTSMMIWDVDVDGRPELVVGSEDCAIRFFRGDEVIGEITETDVVTGLCPLHGSMFGYALANGTVGVYDGMTRRVWRVKSRNVPVCITGFDIDDDGIPELVIGWSNGRLEVRNDKGDLVYRDQFPAALAAFTAADYRMDGKVELIACSEDGEVRGYIPTKPGAHGSLLDKSVVDDTLAMIAQRRQQLEFELKHFEDVARGLAEDESEAVEGDDDSGGDGGGDEEQEDEKVPASSTEFNAAIRLDPTLQYISLVLQAPRELPIHAVVVFGDQTIPGGSLCTYLDKPVEQLEMQVKPQKNQAEDLFVRAFLGPMGNVELLVAEAIVKLPKFAMFAHVTVDKIKEPVSRVSFALTERTVRVVQWLRERFVLSTIIPDNHVDAAFVSLRDSRSLHITVADAIVAVFTDDIDVAGDIIQDLCESLKITELDTTAVFPAELEAFRKTVASVGEYNQTRLKLTAEMADSSNLVKTLLVKAEDSRLLGDMRAMKMAYTTLYEIDRELVGEFKKRANNQAALMRALKDMNQAIQNAARLRVGAAKSKIIAASRDAILGNSIENLFHILRIGASS